MKIRKVIETDYQNIYDLVKIAFETAEVFDGTEQEFVLKLRSSETYIPDLEFVAEDKDELIGHIMMTKQVVNTDTDRYVGLLVAPLCVKLEYRNNGVGSELMNYACKQAFKLGYKAVFLVGNSEYYKRFGFCQTNVYDIKNNSEIPDQFVLACELEPNALLEVRGSINIV